MNQVSTICAIATAPGGALGIIRISGPSAISIANSVFSPRNSSTIKLEEQKGHSMVLGTVSDEKGQILDEVITSIFRAPHSYTGEDCIEFSCHGSSFILQQILALLIRRGCKMAAPGEFTKRAFMNGKMDLSQAESVADLIASKASISHRIAMKQMRGNYSHRFHELRDKLLRLTSLFELELDFSDHEDIEFANRDELGNLAHEIETHLTKFCQSYKVGNVLKKGVPVAIIGETNVGKSTLLNALLEEERAIVSDISGTTRDSIEGTTIINGLVFRFIDTAGIRNTKDAIEQLGIQLSFSKIKQAETILWIIDIMDAEKQYQALESKIIPVINQDQHLIILLNKVDKCDDVTLGRKLAQIENTIPGRKYAFSAKRGEDIERLKTILSEDYVHNDEEDLIVSNTRHYEALQNALNAILRVEEGLQTNRYGDLICQDLRDCIHFLSEITGEGITSQEVLESIFKGFCIGK